MYVQVGAGKKKQFLTEDFAQRIKSTLALKLSTMSLQVGASYTFPNPFSLE